LKTIDGGQTWKQADTLEINSLAIDPSNPRIVYIAAEYSGLWKSEDGGTTMHPLNRGFAGRRLGEITADGETLYAAGTLDGGFQGVFRSEDGGKTWQETSAGSAWAGRRLNALEGIPGKELVFASTGDRLYKSSDKGRTWQVVPIRITIITHIREPRDRRRVVKTGQIKRGRAVVASETVAPKIFGLAIMRGVKPELVAATSIGLLRSANLGVSFEKAHLPGRETTVSSVEAAPDGSPRLVIRTEEGLLLSEGGSGDWKPIHAPVGAPQIYDIAVSPQSDGPVLIGTTDGLYVWRSSEGWAKAKGLPTSTVHAVRFHPGRKGVAYAVQFDHLYQSSDGGVSWEPYSGGNLGELYARRLWISPSRPDRLFAITPDTGVLLLDLDLIQ
ncbi:MAG: WD40/YVTN/BNR-like repeat-containing protein, partial [Bryobacteraceae bacterium]